MNKQHFTRSLLLFALLFVSSLVLNAQTALTSKSGFKVTVPANWKYQIDDEEVLTISSPDEAVAMTFIELEASELEEAMNAVDVELSKLVTDLKITNEGEETTINGMSAIIAEGTGKIDGQDVELGILLVQNVNQVLFVLAFGQSDKVKQHEKAVEEILRSIGR